MSGPLVIVCRGCCCGQPGKHPHTDHDAQLARLRDAAAAGGGRVRVSRCLGVCSWSNVVVVRPPGATRRDERWFGQVLDDAATEAVAGWVAAGAPEDDVAPELAALECSTRTASPSPPGQVQRIEPADAARW